MVDRIGRWAGYVFLIGMGLLALTAVGALFWAIWPKGWREDGAAAWVQAVGSIAAVLIAIAVAAFQVSRQERLARRRDERTVASIVAVAEHAYGLIGMANEELRYEDRAWLFQTKLYDPDEWRDSIASLAAVPLHEMQSPRLVVGIERLKRELRLTFAGIHPPGDYEPWNNFKQAMYLDDRYENASWAMEVIREGALDAVA